MDLISVIMPVHNAGDHLAAAVASILQQTHRQLELLLVDDWCSFSRSLLSALLCPFLSVRSLFLLLLLPLSLSPSFWCFLRGGSRIA